MRRRYHIAATSLRPTTYHRSPGGGRWWTSVDFSSFGQGSELLCHAPRGCQTPTASMETAQLCDALCSLSGFDRITCTRVTDCRRVLAVVDTYIERTVRSSFMRVAQSG